MGANIGPKISKEQSIAWRLLNDVKEERLKLKEMIKFGV